MKMLSGLMVFAAFTIYGVQAWACTDRPSRLSDFGMVPIWAKVHRLPKGAWSKQPECFGDKSGKFDSCEFTDRLGVEYGVEDDDRVTSKELDIDKWSGAKLPFGLSKSDTAADVRRKMAARGDAGSLGDTSENSGVESISSTMCLVNGKGMEFEVDFFFDKAHHLNKIKAEVDSSTN